MAKKSKHKKGNGSWTNLVMAVAAILILFLLYYFLGGEHMPTEISFEHLK